MLGYTDRVKLGNHADGPDAEAAGRPTGRRHRACRGESWPSWGGIGRRLGFLPEMAFRRPSLGTSRLVGGALLTALLLTGSYGSSGAAAEPTPHGLRDNFGRRGPLIPR